MAEASHSGTDERQSGSPRTKELTPYAGGGMRVSRLRIWGFRGVESADIRFPGHAVLLGPNGCGKSTMIDALSLVMGRGRMVRPLTEHDFTGSVPGIAARVRIVATLCGFEPNHEHAHDEWFRMGRGVPKWLDADGIEHAAPGAGRNLAVNIGFAARFDHDEIEVVTTRYFHDDDELEDPFDDEHAPVQAPARLINEVGYFLLPARRAWDAVASFNSDLFRRTVSNTAGIPAEEILYQRDRLREPERPVESSPKLLGLVEGMNARLKRLVPNAPRFRLRVTAGDAEAVLQALQPHYADPGGPSLPVARHGTGLVSLQSLLLLLEVGRGRRERGKPFVLALEEPELHLAPGLQSRLVAEAMQLADQIVVTTHSPEVARVFAANSMLIASNTARRLSAAPFLARKLDASTINPLRKLYGQNRARAASALMHPFVLVPEGRLDAEWLGRIAALADAVPSDMAPFSTVFGIVPTEDSAVTQTVAELAPLRSHVVALLDGDASGNQYRAALLKAKRKPSLVLQWRTGWTIEDVVGWILESGGVAVLKAAQEALRDHTFTSVAELVDLLKRENKKAVVGLKSDLLAHDEICQVIAEHDACLGRAGKLCDAMVSATTESPEASMVRQPQSTRLVAVFRFEP